MKPLSVVLAVVLAAGHASANPCLPIQDAHIRASDFSSIIPAFAVAGDAAIAPAPLAGVTRSFSLADLRRTASRIGVGLPPNVPDSVCFAHPLRRLTASEIQEALIRSGWAAPFEVADFTRFPVPNGEIAFAKAGPSRQLRADGTSLVDGEIRYAPGRRQRIWVRIKPLTRSRVLVARAALPAGTRVRVEDVVTTETERTGSPDQMGSPEEAAGKVLRRSLAAGEPVRRGALSEPRAIDRGQAVRLTVRSGQAQLSVDCVAESGGRAGDRILLRNPSSGVKFKAEVTGAGRAVIALGGQP